MALKTTHAAALCAVLLAGGCSFAEDTLFPTSAPAPQAEVGAPPMLGSSSFEAPGVTNGVATGTFVGHKVTGLRSDLTQLQGMLSRHNQSLQAIRTDTVQDSQRFHGTIAAINARLQVGTTPGNPILNQQWNASQGELDRINEDVLKMTRLANEVTNSSALAAYLLESVRAARQLSGAVDEDHRQLRILEDETNRTVVLVERLLTELSDDINRQQAYVANERQNLNMLAVAIKNGQLYSSALSGRGPSAMAPMSYDAPMAAPRAAVGSDAPLVTIRFDRPNVSYESALYTAVKSAMDRRPGASFDVVAVSPAGSTPGGAALGQSSARRNAEQVVRSLTQMGLPASRIRVSQSASASTQTGEVQVFVR
ncbi:hypothetical protein [Magnetospirillum moscoviense]|uniref:Magnetosome membrane associated protein MmeA n=1 Tax=Magnetospirillum moscoviense TaxID=1437059 RepID=A0A178MPY3_9PROT|nr:hypothetical protein [Magnetospirillum moscoviense]OAN50004.1 hypothetical protein A6A05_01975 [Magnetospirillum moscoviense]